MRTYVSEFDLNHPWLSTVTSVGIPVFVILVLVCWKWIFPAANISIPPARTWFVCLAVVLISVAILGGFDWLILHLTK
ncbi:MAG TPA: hypothetical protein VME24_05955 [Alphaproteobacteria bacterium]|nr:hypothetical protein [Alphaproteobacteria bacterium]